MLVSDENIAQFKKEGFFVLQSVIPNDALGMRIKQKSG